MVAGDAGKHMTVFLRVAGLQEVNRRFDDLTRRLRKIPIPSEVVNGKAARQG